MHKRSLLIVLTKKLLNNSIKSPAVSNIRKIFTGPMYKSLFSFTAISDVYMSFIPNKAAFTK